MKHQAERGGEPWRFPPHVYRRIRRASPIVMIVCMAASCWFFVRVVLLVDNPGGDQTFGADIPVMAGIVAAWVFVVVALFRPPPEVVARTQHMTGDGPWVVHSLGDGMRMWNLISVPLSGVLVGLLIVAGFYSVGIADEDNESSPEANAGEELVVGVLAVVALAAVLVATLWMLSRSILQGVELSESQLIAHGFLRTRRYA